MIRRGIAVPMLLLAVSAITHDLVAQGIQVASRGPRFISASAGRQLAPDADELAVLLRRVTLALDSVPLDQALKAIISQANLEVTYSRAVVPTNRVVSLHMRDVTVAAALTEVLVDINVDVSVARSGHLALVRRPVAVDRQPPGTIVGRVSDAKTTVGIGGVEVYLERTRWRATTDSGGQYRLVDVDSGTYTLVARRLGYTKQTRRVTVRPDRRDTADIVLEPVITRLNELVTTATGRQRRLEVSNDITTLNADSIVRTQPVSSVTDLLEGRVPGLTVQRTSGAPGDPARLRLRGPGSPLRNNDPIVVVDGVRIYAEQSSARNINLAAVGDTTRDPAKGAYATPSPLDYLDPNSIETIEVVKGPSAATLYGQDAANGVIVITTKKGKAGPTSWTVSAEHGRSRLAGDYPDLMLRWGHIVGTSARIPCAINNTAWFAAGIGTVSACDGDSLVTFQLLNDPALTILDQGRHTALTLGASGGSTALTYMVTGSYTDALGLPRLPDYEAERYQARTGSAPPDWMRRPQSLTQWGVTGRFTARLSATADLSLNTALSRTIQQRSSLEQRLGTLMSTYLDRASGIYYYGNILGFGAVTDVITSYYEQALAHANDVTTGLNLEWRPRSWLTVAADAGLNLTQRADEIFLPHGAAIGTDSIGHFHSGQGSTLVSTVNLRANALTPLGRGFQFRFAAGTNYTGTAINDLSSQTQELVPGRRTRGATILGLTPNESDNATFGWYIEPAVSHQRFWFSTGLRLDGGGLYGNGVKGLSLPKFPKLSFSYLVSDEPFFPFKDAFQSFRVRVAYGRASRQPGPTDRLRLYGAQRPVYTDDGQYVGGVFLEALGNTQIRPERSTEFEGGFDADFWQSRVTASVTGYRKTTDDALLSVPLAPSIYGDGMAVLRNVGVIRNTGVEFMLSGQWVRSGPVTWGTQLSLARDRKAVVRLGTGVEPFYIGQGIRVAAGYPLFGRWSTPILGYTDENGDGVLQHSEILRGDTAVYVGQTDPDYTATLETTVSLWQGTFAVSAQLLHSHGVAQKNEVAYQLAPFSRGQNDPTASLAEQAATIQLGNGPVAGDPDDYNWIQTVSTTRLNSLTVRYRVPSPVARRLGARELHVALQGTNLRLWTNYRGLDPNVNAFSTGNNVTDTGILPQPRTWQVRINASY